MPLLYLLCSSTFIYIWYLLIGECWFLYTPTDIYILDTFQISRQKKTSDIPPHTNWAHTEQQPPRLVMSANNDLIILSNQAISSSFHFGHFFLILYILVFFYVKTFAISLCFEVRKTFIRENIFKSLKPISWRQVRLLVQTFLHIHAFLHSVWNFSSVISSISACLVMILIDYYRQLEN